MKIRPACSCVVSLVILCGIVGCGGTGDRPDLGAVSGVVTLDGQPLSDCSVVFKLVGFRASNATTDSSGRYELIYLRDIKGAAVGVHKVSIQDFSGKRRVPARYAKVGELEAKVEPGNNVIDFELKSK